jgi:hypothetical protein
MKNYLGQTLGLTVLVLIMVAGLGLVPNEYTFGDFQFRKMDIFSDVHPDQSVVSHSGDPFLKVDPIAPYIPDTLAMDTSKLHLPAVVEGPLPPVDSMYYGKVFEDYTHGQHGLNRFFAGIDSIRSHGRTVRVAFFGDSFVEGDIMIGDLRDSLQTVWGGEGVGFVPITSEVARFKRTLQHEFRGWNAVSIVKNRDSRVPFGINGFAYVPQNDAFIHYEGAKYFRHTQRWTQFRLYYTAGHDLPFIWQKESQEAVQDKLPGKPGKLSCWKWSLPQTGTHTFDLRFPRNDSLICYGACLENGPGFYIDNFSVRGNTGGPLKLIRSDFVRQFDHFQQYDLIVIQVGLNAVTNSLNNINWYRAELDRTFDHLRECFPGKPILVVSVGDRADKIGDALVTMRGVPFIVAMQRELARKHGFLFYDLFHGMGGPGSIVGMANHKPMLANKDYTHLTHEGGRVIGHMFARLFMEEQAHYMAKKAVKPDF